MRTGVYLIVFWTIVWVAMAVPTAAFARRLGDPSWISWLVWFPHWVPLARPSLFAAVPFLAEQHATPFISWVMYLIPGVVYLWVLAVRFAVSDRQKRDNAKAA
jgi:hypothetical protein